MTDATLSAKVIADIADFTKKMDAVHHAVDGLAKGPSNAASATASAADSIEHSTGRWKVAFLAATVAIAGGIATAIDTLHDWTAASAKAAEKVEQISQQTGIAQTTLEGWSVALNRVGLDTEVFSQAYKALSKDIVVAGQAADFSKTKFAQMGLTKAQLGDTETVIRAIADRLAGMTDPAARAQLAVDLLGKQGLKLLPAFMQGSAGLDALIQKSRDLGLVLDQSARTNLLKYDDALDDLGKAWEGLKTRVAVAAAPILTKSVELAQSGIVMAGKIIDAVVRMVNGVDQAFQRLGVILTSVREKTEAVTGFFRSMYDAVVGHSWVPDMVDDIGRHMNNLDIAMTAPARQATVATGKAFEGLAFTTQGAMNQVVSTINFAWGSATQNVSNALAQMTTRHVEWAQVGIQIGQQFLAAMINQVIALMTQWAIATVFAQTQNTAQLAAHTATEGAKMAITATAEAARLGVTLATNKAILASSIKSVVAIGAVGNAALSVLGVVLAATVGFMYAVAAAVVYAPYVGQALAGAIIASATLAEVTGLTAITAGTAALNAALGAAVVSIGSSLAVPAFARGGIVTGPTLALIGEAGPEAVVPLGSEHQFGATGPITIMVQIDGRVAARAILPYLHHGLRTQAIGA